jgi:hypothetical protein
VFGDNQHVVRPLMIFNGRQDDCCIMTIANANFVPEYGPVIRIAPDEVHASDPEAIPLIYSIQQPLKKTDWYRIYRIADGSDLFTEDDEKHHAAHRRMVGHAYALTSMLKNESAIDDTMNLFTERLGEFADRKEAFDFGNWLEM